MIEGILVKTSVYSSIPDKEVRDWVSNTERVFLTNYFCHLARSIDHLFYHLIWSCVISHQMCCADLLLIAIIDVRRVRDSA